MLGSKRRLFPTVLIAMRKNLLPYVECFRASELCVKCLTKETKSGSMSWLCGRQFFFSQRLWMSVFQCTRLGSLFEKRKKKRGNVRGWVWCPLFLYLFIYCYLLQLFCWNSFVRPNPEWDTVEVLQEAALRFLAQHLHIPKRLFLRAACLLFLGDSSSNAFFAHLTPSGTAIIQAHSILRGWEKGTEQRRSQRGLKPSM